MCVHTIQEDQVLAILFDKWPATIQVFLRHRMACVGCPMANFNTIKDATWIYKLNHEQFLFELYQVIQATEVD